MEIVYFRRAMLVFWLRCKDVNTEIFIRLIFAYNFQFLLWMAVQSDHEPAQSFYARAISDFTDG